MPRLLSDRAECFVSVFKEGALSRVGHDVMFQFGRVTLSVGEDLAMTAEFPIDSLRVVGAIVDGQPQPHVLSVKDQRDITGNIAKVLEPRRHPSARYISQSVTATDNGYEIKGELTLHGVTRPINMTATRRDGMATARAVVHQPQFGIKPFKALLGALRIKPDVAIEFRVPYDDA